MVPLYGLHPSHGYSGSLWAVRLGGGARMDLAFDEVEAPPARRTWLWLGVAGVGTLLLVLFLVAPAAAAVAGLILLSAIPLAVLAGSPRTTAPLAAAGAVSLVALGGSAVALAVEMRAPETVEARTKSTPAQTGEPRAVVPHTPSQAPAVLPPRAPATAPPNPAPPAPVPVQTRAPAPVPVPAPPAARPPAPAAPSPSTAPPRPAPQEVAPPPAPSTVPQPAPGSVSVRVSWGRLSAEARVQVCAATSREGLSVPPGQCR